MTSKKLGLFITFVACLAMSESAFAIFASTSGEMSDSTTQATNGTSNSTSGSSKKIFGQNNQDRQNQFVQQNFDRLQEQAARGSGSLLSDYVSLMGCQNSGFINKSIQENYSQLFNGGKAQLLERTQHMIKQSPALTHACEIRS